MTKLTEADNKFIRDFLNAKEEDFNAQNVIRTNPFTDEEFEVSPIVAKAIDFVQVVEQSFGNESRLKRISQNLTIGNAVQKFDRARMLVMKMDSNAFMGIIN